MKYYKSEHHNFDPAFRLHELCADDDLRPAFQYVHFMNGYAYATDAHVLIRANINEISDFKDEEIAMLDHKCIHARLFRQIIQRRVIKITPEGFLYEDQTGDVSQLFKFHEIGEDRTIDLFANDKFACCGTKVPDLDAVIDDDIKTTAITSIGVNADCVQRVVRAIGGARMIQMSFNGDNRAITIRPIDEELKQADIIAVIMPVLCEDMPKYVRKIKK